MKTTVLYKGLQWSIRYASGDYISLLRFENDRPVVKLILVKDLE